MSTECCICTRPDEYSCPSCDQPFCFSCFVDHGKQCYESMKKKAEQKKCSVCGRYASINPTVHCSDCQIDICRSCLYAHRKTHEKKKCSGCNGDPAGPFVSCPDCRKELCEACMEIHRTRHGTWQEQSKPRYRCATCGTPTTTECDECKQPYCESCFAKHRTVHEQKKESICPECGLGFFVVSYSWIECPDCHQRFHAGCYYGKHTHKEAEKKTGHKTYRCSGCNRLKTCSIAERAPFWECPTCHEYYCEACAMRHTHVYARANFAGRFNVDDFTVHGVNFKIDPDFLKESLKTAERIRQEAEEQKRKQEEEARRAQERKRVNDEFWQNMFRGNSFWGEEEEPDAYKAHYTGQQSQNHSQYSRQQTRTSAPSHELVAAFKLLQLSTRATVQEVKRARNRLAKQGEYRHPDVGGIQAKFVELNNAYELALQHAESNER